MTDIPVLPALDLAVEELIRTVQECGDIVRRKDTRAIESSNADLGRLTTTLAGRTSLTPKDALDAIQQSLRGFILLKLMGDELRSDWDGRLALEQAEAVPVGKVRVTAEPVKPTDFLDTLERASGHTFKPENREAIRRALAPSETIVYQLATAIGGALDTAESLQASHKKYTDKFAVESDAQRAMVYGLLAVSSAECSRLHLEIGKQWRKVLGQIIKGAVPS